MDAVESGNMASSVSWGKVSGLIWKFNRLRAMNFREVLHRVASLTSQKIERIAIAWGWAPKPARSVKPGLTLFLPQEGWLSAWQQYYHLEQAQLEGLLQGKIGFFGHAPLDVGLPVNWHRDPLTGIEAPLSFGKELNYRDDGLVGNVKIIWELGRHQHLIPLAVAYACTGGIRYRDALVAQIESWIDDNPYGLGIHWCSALEPALRLISWAVVHSLLTLRDGEGGLFSVVSDSEKLGSAIYRQTWFVRHFLSRYSSANNHLIGELTGLWVACCVFDMGKPGKNWAETAQQQLEREALLQVYSDGVNKEQACYYHLWVLEYFLFAWIVGLRSKQVFSESFGKRVLAMADFLHAITPAGGVPPQIGDADDGFVTRFNVDWPEDEYREVLSAVEAVFGNGRLSPPLPQKAFWYAFCAGKMPEVDDRMTAARKSYPMIFQEGGYAVMGGKVLHLVFVAGSLGYPSIAAHGHADALNVCLALDGAWWLVDPGTYAYHSDHGWRDYFRGTAAHNTLQMDGCSQSEIGGPFLWLQHAHARLVGTGVNAVDLRTAKPSPEGEGWVRGNKNKEKSQIKSLDPSLLPEGEEVRVLKSTALDAGVNTHGVQWVVGEHDGYKKLGGMHSRRVELDNLGGEITITDEVQGNGEHELTLHFHFAPDIALVPGAQDGTWLATKSGNERRMVIEVDVAWHWEVLRGSESPRLGWFSSALGEKVAACTLRGAWRGCLPARVVTKIIVQEQSAFQLWRVN